MSITLVQGDEFPAVRALLFVEGLDGAPDTPYDASGHDIQVLGLFTPRGEQNILSTLPGVKVPGVVNEVHYAFTGGVLDVETGEYDLWHRIVVPQGEQTVLKPVRIRVIAGPTPLERST